MEEIIRFRLSVNLLDTQEFNIFVNQLGKDEIISIMLKAFIQKQLQTQQIKDITNIISNIVESRETNKLNANSKSITDESFKINKLPNVLIRECASFLHVIDYLHFSQCDGLIYVACNSPSSLQYLDMTKNGYPYNLNKFPLLKTIRLNPLKFTKKYNNCSIALKHIKHLSLDMNNNRNHSEIVKFMSMQCINFANISTLTLLRFGSYKPYNTYAWQHYLSRTGSYAYDFHSFCEFLNKCVNVNCLSIYQLYIADFFNNIKERNIISKLLPQLKRFTFQSKDMNANLFANKLIETHSKQIIHLGYDEKTDNLHSNSLKSLKLRELIAHHPRLNTISQLITQSTQLKSLFIDLSNIKSSTLVAMCDNNQKIKNIITSFCTNSLRMKKVQLQLCMNFSQIEKIIECIEMALQPKHIKSLKYDYLKIMYEIYYKTRKISINEINLYLTRMLNALSLCTNHFMIIFNIHGHLDTIDASEKVKLNQLINNLKKNYLVFDDIRCTNDFVGMYQKIVVSNKQCAINGYQQIVNNSSKL